MKAVINIKRNVLLNESPSDEARYALSVLEIRLWNNIRSHYFFYKKKRNRWILHTNIEQIIFENILTVMRRNYTQNKNHWNIACLKQKDCRFALLQFLSSYLLKYRILYRLSVGYFNSNYLQNKSNAVSFKAFYSINSYRYIWYVFSTSFHLVVHTFA